MQVSTDILASDTSVEKLGTVARTVHMLRALAEHNGPITNKLMAEKLGLAPSTTHRLLELLMQEGLVERDESRGAYRVGKELYRLAALVGQKFDLVEFAGPILESLVSATNETVVLSLYNAADQTVFYALTMNSPNSLGYRLELNRPVSAIWGATGKAILAFLDESDIDAALGSSKHSPASNASPPSREQLYKEVQEIRDRGFAQSQGEKIFGAASLAVPIFNSKRRPIGSLAVTIPQFRFSAGLTDVLAPVLKQEAEQLSGLVRNA